MSAHRNDMARPTPALPFRTFGFEAYQVHEGVRYISSRHGELYPIEKPNGTFRIVCFGGSTTAWEADGDHYPLLLQAMLRERLERDDIEVINVGNEVYATPHSLILLALDVLSWDPDLVILNHNVNDLSASYWADFTFDYSNKYADRSYRYPQFSVFDSMFQHSQAYWFFRHKYLGIKSWRKVIYLETYGDGPNSVTRDVFERNLKSFVTLAQSNEIQILLATQPLWSSEEYFPIDFDKGRKRPTRFPPLQEFSGHHDSYNELIKKVALEVDVLFLDNQRIMSDKKEYFVDSIHYSKEGMAKLAENYADFLVVNHVIK